MTNGDRIRGMTDVQLSVYLTKVQIETLNLVRDKLGIERSKFPSSAIAQTEEKWIAELKQEVEE